MIQVRKEWYDREIDRTILATVDIVLNNGQKITTSADDIMQSGLQIEDAVSTQGSFDLGAAIIGKAVVLLNNYHGKFSSYDFSQAEIRPKISLFVDGVLIETVKKGVYFVDLASTLGNVIRLECLDRMALFDCAYDTDLSYPTTIGNIVYDACVKCGVPIATTTFFNSGYVVNTKPSGEMNYREVIAYCSQLAGCFARMNVEGQLEIKWYDTEAFPDSIDGGNLENYELENKLDGGDFTDYNQNEIIDGGSFLELSKYHHIYSYTSLDVSTDDVIITGCKMVQTREESEKEYMYGSEGYVLTIENNPFAQNDLQALVNSIGSKVIGMRFRPLNVCAISDLSVEAGDTAIVTDRKGNEYRCYFTNIHYTLGGYETYTCDAKTESEQKSVRYTPYTKIERKIAKEVSQKLNGFEQQFSQFNELMTNAMGFYQTSEKQEDGSIIVYLHNKPELTSSQTIWKWSVDGFAVSLDGGKTWTAGITKQGNIIANILSVMGINADWINAGSINAININGSKITGSYIESKSGTNTTTISDGMVITNNVVLPSKSGNTGFLSPNQLILYNSGNTSYISLNADTGMVETHNCVRIGKAVIREDGIELMIKDGNTRPTVNGLEVAYLWDLQMYATGSFVTESIQKVYDNLVWKSVFDIHKHDSLYANINHNHNSMYAGIAHNHDSTYSKTDHTHFTSLLTASASMGAIQIGDVHAVGWAYAHRTFQMIASDFRLKKDMKQLDDISSIYLNLKPYEFSYKSNISDNKKHIGLIAQEFISVLEYEGIEWKDYAMIQEIQPLDFSNEDMYIGKKGYGINYNELHGWHIYMIQKQQKEIENLKEENQKLRTMIEQIEARLLKGGL